MSRTRVRTVVRGDGQRKDQVAQERAATERALADLGLEIDGPVRFHKKEGGTWVEGKVLGINKDGSLSLSAQGQLRSIHADQCQRKTFGPRGGTIWEDIT